MKRGADLCSLSGNSVCQCQQHDKSRVRKYIFNMLPFTFRSSQGWACVCVYVPACLHTLKHLGRSWTTGVRWCEIWFSATDLSFCSALYILQNMLKRVNIYAPQTIAENGRGRNTSKLILQGQYHPDIKTKDSTKKSEITSQYHWWI